MGLTCSHFRCERPAMMICHDGHYFGWCCERHLDGRTIEYQNEYEFEGLPLTDGDLLAWLEGLRRDELVGYRLRMQDKELDTAWTVWLKDGTKIITTPAIEEERASDAIRMTGVIIDRLLLFERPVGRPRMT